MFDYRIILSNVNDYCNFIDFLGLLYLSSGFLSLYSIEFNKELFEQNIQKTNKKCFSGSG